MKRAAILIGVENTGSLPQLRDACRGARDMEAWAIQQEFDEIHCFTDEDGPVHVLPIKEAIEGIVAQRNFDQLVVYFAGHGVNLRYSEYWLLSRAPQDPQAAVNLQGSVALARQSGIPHVVFMSDACRTAAEDIQAQQVTGSEIFPNDPVGGPEKPVDIFFATILGKPAQEVRDPRDSAAAFRALYTDALKSALEGSAPEVVEQETESGQTIGLVRPRPLRDFLGPEMLRRLRDLNLHLRVHQVPDARITSDPDVWVSRVPWDPDAPPAVGGPPDEIDRGGGDHESGEFPDHSLRATSEELLDSALAGELDPLEAAVRRAEWQRRVEPDRALVAHGTPPSFPADRLRFETACGLELKGATATRVLSAHAQCELIDPGDRVGVYAVDGPASSVLLVLPDETSVLVPILPDFIAGLTFEEGRLSDVTYEPAENSDRWAQYEDRKDDLRTLRGVVAASAGLGVFRLEGPNSLRLAQGMQYSKGVDPSLALYAAYAYNDLLETERIERMNEYLGDDLSMTFFDVAMLARTLDGRVAEASAHLAPPLPMLGQGWALLPGHRIELGPRLQGIQRRLLSNLWTQFSPEGTAQVWDAIEAGEVW